MSTLLIVLLVILLLGGGGYYGHRSYGPAGLGGVVGLVLVVVLILWLLGAIGGAPLRVCRNGSGRPAGQDRPVSCSQTATAAARSSSATPTDLNSVMPPPATPPSMRPWQRSASVPATLSAL